MGLLWKPKLPAAAAVKQMPLFSPAVSAAMRSAAPVLGQDVQSRVVALVVPILIIVAQYVVSVVVFRSVGMLRQKAVQLQTRFATLTHRDGDYQGGSRVSHTRGLHLCYFLSV